MSDKSALWGDWAAYHKALNDEHAEPVREPDEPIRVIQPGRELDGTEKAALKGTLGSLFKRLNGRGWTVRVGYSRAWNPAVRYENDGDDYSKGDVRYAAFEADCWEVFAHKSAAGATVGLHATWAQKDGKPLSFLGARTLDPYLGEEWRPTASKPRKQRDWEAEEGVPAPMSFTEWLKLVAPTEAELKKRKKEAADG
ncbi:hypothetical protein [Microbacterium sp.]|uniref:hypothetical protein n=1 Tax=Microbacterium sp. TaxID=51671 RepID=UPI0039E31193